VRRFCSATLLQCDAIAVRRYCSAESACRQAMAFGMGGREVCEREREEEEEEAEKKKERERETSGGALVTYPQRLRYKRPLHGRRELSLPPSLSLSPPLSLPPSGLNCNLSMYNCGIRS
jgi:hypothetical protein